jgi:phosphoglycerol transferase
MSTCPVCLPARVSARSPGDQPPREVSPAARPSTARTLAAYGGTAALSLVILLWALQLWKADLSVPLSYGGDGIYYQTLIKGMIDNGWYLHNDRLGRPGVMELGDFPISDGWFHYLVVKLLGWLVPDAAVVFNLFCLLTFPLVATSALFVLRRLGVSSGIAAVVALLFTFLPFHLLRLGHLFLAAYYFVPLTVLVVVRLSQGRLPFGHSRSGTWGVLAVCVLTGMGGVYYALFTCFFLAVAGVARAWAVRSRRPLLEASGLACLTFTALLVTLAPSIHYRHTHGGNPERGRRSPCEAEMYGLKISQLVLPVFGHRIPRLHALAARYEDTAPLVNENKTAALGLVGAFGFFWLVARMLLRRPRDGRDPANVLALLTVAAVLLATVGGLGTLLAYVSSPWLRGYNRISVYLGFFALAAVALLLEKARRRWARTPRKRLAFGGLLALLLVGGLLDQTSAAMVPPYAYYGRLYADDGDFARKIEVAVPAGSFVFQLPYGEFPEGLWTKKYADIDLMRPYLHTQRVGWSYGSLRGHSGARWARATAALPSRRMVEALAEAGASGIYIDRRAFKDRAAALERKLRWLLGPPAFVHASGQQVFFKIGRPALAHSSPDCFFSVHAQAACDYTGPEP